jgi:hypothetical protein
MSPVSVRSYAADDREAVQHISYRTGFMGESAQSFWSHKQSWADLWTFYYTDQEPESLYVATMDDTVVGYLAGCMDTAAMTPSTDEIMQAVIRKYWLLFRPGTADSFTEACSTACATGSEREASSSTLAGRRTCTSTCSR